MFASQIDRLKMTYKNSNNSIDVIVPDALFERILSAAIDSVEVDERWYCEKYQDVADAIEAKICRNAIEHYRRFGWKENRLPRYIEVDEDYYLRENPDVAEGVKKGDLQSAQNHFEYLGIKEGRLPYADFRLF